LATVARVMTGIGKLFNAWREDRREKASHAGILDRVQRRDLFSAAFAAAAGSRRESCRRRWESLLMDAVAREQEDHRERTNRPAIATKSIDLTAAMTSALKESTVILAQIKKNAP